MKYFEAVVTDASATASAPAATAQPAAAASAPDDNASALAANMAPAANSLDWVQEKYHVKDAVGVIDEAASIRKQAEAYGPLAKRLGTDQLPPAKATDYKFTAPQGIEQASFDEFAKDPATAKFIEAAHGKGFNNDQVQFALEAALAMQPAIDTATVQERDDATKAYVAKNLWKDDAASKAGFQAVLNVVDTLATKTGISRDAFTTPLQLADGVTLPPAINDPRVLALLNAIAPDMKTGFQPNAGSLPAADIESLQKSDAYWNPNHKDHTATKERVDAHYSQKFGSGGKAQGPVVISSR